MSGVRRRSGSVSTPDSSSSSFSFDFLNPWRMDLHVHVDEVMFEGWCLRRTHAGKR